MHDWTILVTQLHQVLRLSVCVIDTHNRVPPATMPSSRCQFRCLTLSMRCDFDLERKTQREIVRAIHFNRVPKTPSRRFASSISRPDRHRFADVVLIIPLSVPPCLFRGTSKFAAFAYRSFFLRSLCVCRHRSPLVFCRRRPPQFRVHGEYPGNGGFFVEGAASSKTESSPPITILTTKAADTTELLIRHFLPALPRGRSAEDIKLAILYRSRCRRRRIDDRSILRLVPISIIGRVLSYASAATPLVSIAR